MFKHDEYNSDGHLEWYRAPRDFPGSISKALNFIYGITQNKIAMMFKHELKKPKLNPGFGNKPVISVVSCYENSRLLASQRSSDLVGRLVGHAAACCCGLSAHACSFSLFMVHRRRMGDFLEKLTYYIFGAMKRQKAKVKADS